MATATVDARVTVKQHGFHVKQPLQTLHQAAAAAAWPEAPAASGFAETLPLDFSVGAASSFGRGEGSLRQQGLLNFSTPCSAYAGSAAAAATAADGTPVLELPPGSGCLLPADYAHLTPGVKRLMKGVVRGLKAFQVGAGCWVLLTGFRALRCLVGAAVVARGGCLVAVAVAQVGALLRTTPPPRDPLACPTLLCLPALLQEPEAATEGLGGTYFFTNEAGQKIGIMKPCDEEPLAPNNPKGFVGRQLGEPGLKPTVRVGEAASREVGGAGGWVARPGSRPTVLAASLACPPLAMLPGC